MKHKKSKFIKKYWWVFLVLFLVAVVLLILLKVDMLQIVLPEPSSMSGVGSGGTGGGISG